jgi:hypothetical protein
VALTIVAGPGAVDPWVAGEVPADEPVEPRGFFRRRRR